MRLLLDTHALLWWRAGDDRFGAEAERAIRDPANETLISAVVAWEIAIKRSLGKLRAPKGVVTTSIAAGATALPVIVEHAAAVEHLPWHHRDPFDRLLVAQAQLERAVLVSSDDTIRSYGVPVVW